MPLSQARLPVVRRRCTRRCSSAACCCAWTACCCFLTASCCGVGAQRCLIPGCCLTSSMLAGSASTAGAGWAAAFRRCCCSHSRARAWVLSSESNCGFAVLPLPPGLRPARPRASTLNKAGDTRSLRGDGIHRCSLPASLAMGSARDVRPAWCSVPLLPALWDP